ncbi:MAG: peptide ABC transporter substrate-binding protein [Anaerolineae bacterium]|nr:peptide ABC transporter substrate-binding protein [Anaerolineae bacterium]
MKKFRWQLIIIFLTGLVVGVLLLAEQPNITTTVGPTPSRGGVYSEALIGELQRLNPVLDYYNSVDRDVNRFVFSGLIKFDSRGVSQPDLADSWGISKDGTVYNFSLRSNAKFHDGQPVTAEDVAFTIEMIKDPGSIVPDDLKAFWSEIEVIPLSSTTIQFRLPEPFAPFLDYLTFGILPSHVFAGMSYDEMVDSPVNLQPIGSGPYQFDQLLIEDGKLTGIILKAFNDFYLSPPFIDQIIFRYYPDEASALNAYRDGEVLGISHVGDEILKDVLAEPDLSLYSGRQPTLSIILFNLDHPEKEFFQDVELRKALMQGLNRQYIIDNYLDGQAILANGVVFPGTWAYYDGTPEIEFDPEKAIKKLSNEGFAITGDESGIRVKDDIQLEFSLIYPDDITHQAVAEEIQKNWRALGVGVNLEPLPYDVLVNERLVEKDYDAALIDINLSRSPDPDPYPFWDQAQASGGQNYSQWNNRIASEYLEQARIITDLDERSRLYRNFQVVFSEDLPAIPLYYPVYNYAIDYQVLGVRMGPLYDANDRFATHLEWFFATRRPESATLAPTVTTAP